MFVETVYVDLTALLEKTLTGLGYELVDLELANRGMHVRVFADKAGGISIDDCAAISDHLSRLFAVENIDYDRLEVSSPGLDRPLKRLADYQRFRGAQLQVKLRVPMNGRKRVTGVLQDAESTGFRLKVEGELLRIEFSNVDKARLVPDIDWRGKE